MKEIRVPELGENIDTAEVVSILVELGQQVKKNQGLIEVESDKASLEIPATGDGIIESINVTPGQQIRPGQIIMTLGDEDSKAATAPSATKESKDQMDIKAKTPELTTPSSAVESVEKPQKVYAKGGAQIPVPVAQKPVILNAIPASPSVRRFARELGVDLHKVEGSGLRSRIQIGDVQKFVKNLIERRDVRSVGILGSGVPDLPDFEVWGPVKNEKMSGIRKTIAERMSFASSHIPHVTQFDETDITHLEAFLQTKEKEFVKRKTKITLTAIMLKAMSIGLERFRVFNSSLDIKHDQIIYKDYINIGVAVDTDRGLMVPVIRDVDQKDIWQLASELNELARLSRERKIKPDQLQGGNISLTNLGGLGTTYFTPIINWPDVAVLGMGKASTRALMLDGQWEPRKIMPLSVSYDHRIIDGADAARFLRTICLCLEEPLSILLGI